MAGKKQKQEGVGAWVAIVILFAIGLWPIALVMLLVKLFGNDGQKRRQAPPPLQTAAPEPAAAASAGTAGRTKKAVRSAMKSPAVKKSNAKWLKIIGAVLAVCGLAACWSTIEMMIWLGGVEPWYIEELLWALAIAAAGGAMFCSGVSIGRSLKRYNKYLAVVGNYEAMAVEQLCRTLGYSRDRVEKDLQKMIDKGYFGDEAYLNMELGYLFRSGQADADLKQKRRQEEAAAAPPPKETEEGCSGILRRIRRANDAIADPGLSAKIDRLETITAKIFRAVEEDPKKRDRIDTFLNYYLPTTQKLLDSYAEFEAAGVAQGNGQVKGPHKDAVYTVHSGDLLNVLQAAHSFALGQQQRLPVAGLHIAGNGDRMGGVAPAAVPGGAEAPVPQRRELGIPDQLPDFLHGLHAGDHHTLGTHVQQPQHCRAGDLIGPGQSRQACALGGGDLGRSRFDPGGGVLRVHDHIVQSGITQALHRQGAADGGEGSQALAALVKFF